MSLLFGRLKHINTADKKGLLKISQVAKAADISVTTVKYYVKEGLIDIACKTGKNMAYYAPESVERVKLIKSLQTEKYYPLAVIKRILKNGGTDEGEVELLDVISKGDQSDYYQTISIRQAAQNAQLKMSEVQSLIDAGIIEPIISGRNRLCSRGDERVMKLIKRRKDAGIPPEQSVRSFAMYQEHLKETARLDTMSLVADGMLTKTLSTSDIVKIINVSDETLDSFISMKRYALNAAMGTQYISQTENMFRLMECFARAILSLLSYYGFDRAEKLLSLAITGETTGNKILDEYCHLLHLEGKGIAYSLSALHKARLEFEKPPAFTGDDGMDATSQALRLGFVAFAPQELGFCLDAGMAAFQKLPNRNFVSAVSQLLNELRNEKI